LWLPKTLISIVSYRDFNDLLHAYDGRHVENQVRPLNERFEQRKIENGAQREMERPYDS